MKKCKLCTPDGKAIVGIKAKDGSVIPCTHVDWASNSLSQNTVFYEIPDGYSIKNVTERTILIDEDDVEWPEIDIWYVSLK